MTTQEKSKQEMLALMREKREAKKQSRLKAKRRKRIAATIVLAAVLLTAFGTVFNASAKEITITEIDEFSGINESKTIRTRSERVEDVLEENGLDVGVADKINVSVELPVDEAEDIVIVRGKQVTIKVDGCEELVTVTKADATEALVEAGYIPGEYDRISTTDDTIDHGDVIELVSISYTNEVTKQKIERGIEYVDDPSLMKGEERVMDEGYDGEKEISHKVTYQDGAETTREMLSEVVISEPKNKIIARGTATPKSKKVNDASASRSSVNDNGGYVNGYKYKKKITMTATAYSTAASENGGYTVSAMGNPLKYGIVAVDPNVIPLGSTVYVTSPDGSWTYGVASAEDTGGAIKGNKIDLCIPSGAKGFGRRSCVVYVLE